ncbi:MAG: Na(+)/H(+) antiporter subunit B [Candidatus Aminicenantes bacterium]|nr:Na(+)/H(+) antiporter subunit B [Candidatus Aminicenantes bacterium]
MRRNENNPIIDLISSLVAPFILLFGLYVIFHGHYSPGGGFQGGTLLAAGVILLRLSLGSELGQKQFPSRLGTPLSLLGVLVYFGTGLAALLLGGTFLDYAAVPLAALEPLRRSWGILAVEAGVGLAVMAVLVAIYDDLLDGEPDA